MKYLVIQENFFSHKKVKMPSVEVNSLQSPLKYSIVGQNLKEFQVKVKCYNLPFTVITEWCAGKAWNN